jgi:hypothetical protein
VTPDTDWRVLPDPHDTFEWRCRNLVLEFRLVHSNGTYGPWYPIRLATVINKPTPARKALWSDLFVYPCIDSHRA